MKQLKCESCSEMWIVSDDCIDRQKVCPFCASSIREEVSFSEIDSLDKAIYAAVSRFGLDALKNPRQMVGFMMDIAPQLKKEIKIFSKAVSEEYAGKIGEVFDKPVSEIGPVIGKIKGLLIDEEGMSESWAEMICTNIQAAAQYSRGIGTTKIAHVLISDYQMKAGTLPPSQIKNATLLKKEKHTQQADESKQLMKTEKVPELSKTDAYLLERVRCHNTPIVEELLKKGANPNCVQVMKSGEKQFPLLIAVRQGDVDTAEALIRRGANVNASGEMNGAKYPLLMEALKTWWRSEEVTELLLKNGANPSARFRAIPNADNKLHATYYDVPVLDAAICSGKTEIVEMLLESGADMSESIRAYNDGTLIREIHLSERDYSKYIKTPNLEKILRKNYWKGPSILSGQDFEYKI